ncbi:GMC family oxidoreductase [Prosthecomicrobium hirschii]|uniref:GMC family oxidoreductase n=1 Tax=Prosthecodimorpha hirschii TaxID=665126 RepID=UPI00221E6A64|nr:GMC family oxidoreductase N-terminal domain-containing protein [Prosthecomicrobium hirschii]MCW1843528.1 FAD-dependent oxidoreductase [Prosthecomicrobium hirschii]
MKDLGEDLRSTLLDKLETSLLRGTIRRRQFLQWSLALGLGMPAASALADTLDAARANQDARAKALSGEFDIIVCGAGTSGCTLAGRLAEAGLKVALIEAGDWDTAPSILDPGQWFMNLGTERDWGDVAVPTASVNGRAIASHMGRAVGGGSSINATIWVRPPRADLDGWAETAGDKAWGYDAALKLFTGRIENWQGPASPYRGKGGKVWSQVAADPPPIAPAMLAAARNLGLPVSDDLNGAREEAVGGFALMNQIIKDGRRMNMAQAYLYPVIDRPNLTVLTRTRVTRLVVESGKVVGIKALRDGAEITLRAAREVVLSLGAIRTPQILMLSGIGDRAHLAQHGIASALHVPEVGRNFHDHILHGGCIWESPEPVKMKNSAANASGFWKSDPAFDRPDMNIVQIELPYASDAIGKEYGPPASAWALCAGLVDPKSRGEVRLASADPTAKPVVTANFLSDPRDVKSQMAAIDLCRQIGNDPAMKPYAKREAVPGKALDPDAKAQFVRNGATTFFHQVGTARMGKDDGAVVGADLKVKGLAGLRIVDGSIMPRIVTCATMATCVLIGERGADLVLAGK